MNKTAQSTRDTRIDVFRALALISIYVNHVPGTVYEALTHKNVGFSDAAEAFVLISGIAAGFAYGSKFAPGNRLLMTIRAWRRAGVLYVTHIMTTVATLAIFSAGALWFARADLLQKINLPTVFTLPPDAFLGLATLGHQLGYNNILSMYCVVLLMLPAFLLLLKHGPAVTIAASGALWLAAGLLKLAPPNYPLKGVWFLNPLSWQFLFVIGLVCVVHVKRGGKIPVRTDMLAAAAAYLVLAFFWVRVPLWGIDTSMGLPRVLTGFDKTYLSLPRLLHVLAIAYVIVAFPKISRLAQTASSHPLAILGRQALPVFIAGTILAMAAQVLRISLPESLALDTVLIVTGVALQFALAYWLEWLQQLKKGAQRAPAMALTAGALRSRERVPRIQPNASASASAAALDRAAAISSRTSL